MNITHQPNAIVKIVSQKDHGGKYKINAIHSHHNREDVINLIQKGTFLELTEELAMHEGCIAAFKEFKKLLSKCIKQDKYSDSSKKEADIAKIQAATQGISSDTIMMGLLEKKIKQLTSDMFEQQDKSPEPSEKTEEK